MSTSALNTVLDRHYRQAALEYRMNDELGILHGLSWADFVLLNLLDSAGGVIASTELAQQLSIAGSRLLLQLIPLEKTGLIARSSDEGGAKRVCLRPNAQRHVREARETAARICDELLAN